MNYSDKEIRTVQIAAVFLMRNIAGIKVEVVESTYYDLLATVTTDGFRFGVKVVNSSFLRSNHYATYLEELTNIDIDDKYNRKPIILISVNEADESLMIGMQMGWRWGKARIFKKPSMMAANKMHSDMILDSIKSMDETIRILSEHGIKIKKTINIDYTDIEGLRHYGEIIYLRDFTERYKMHQKEVVNERERFSKPIRNTPEEDYPSDFLDDTILDMVKQNFPNSTINNKIVLFTTDLDDIQRLSALGRVPARFIIEPNISGLPPFATEMLKGISLINFSLDLFVFSPTQIDYFRNQGFTLSIPYQGWLNTFNKYQNVLKTLHSPTEFYI